MLYAIFGASLISQVICYSFNIENVNIIGQNSVKNTYFSYSLLLQTDRAGTSSLIVGAPKNINDTRFGGNLYNCDINKSTCVQYPVGRSIDSSSPNGNFFGMNLDGDDYINGALVACAPRTLATDKRLNYLRGYCIYMNNTLDITQPPISIIPISNGYDSACCDSKHKLYYNLGFAMAGFDVAFSSQSEILLGAPGIKKYNGAVFSYSLENPRMTSMVPMRNMPLPNEEDTYFGYSVTSAQFQPDSKDVWTVAGAPRANDLRGKVTIYYYDIAAKEKMHVVTSFKDDEAGSYFGASILALDVTNDRVIDVLVGAPTAAGKTWDEGSVYFYKGLNEKSFLRRVKLTGSSKIGSRFGSAIVSLGDFDLDGYNDIAISAPYEDDGTGAVYIYRGSYNGLTDQFSQILSPVDFALGGIRVKGFGMGISKGNDIDGNGHNDIAIGAYKTDQVFIIKSYSIIDYQISLYPKINSINKDTTSFSIQFCIIYHKRSEELIVWQVDFGIALELDYRSIEGNVLDQITVDLGLRRCKEYDIHLKQTAMDISPFQINLYLETKTANIIAHGERSLDIRIPYSHGCGDDNVCNTDMTIGLKADRESIILGLHKDLILNIAVTNNGEPAYQCEIKLVVPDVLDLRNSEDCVKTNGNYTCLLNERLTGSLNKQFIFDIRETIPDITSIEIKAEVSSLGTNKPGNIDVTELILPVLLDSTPYVVGKSIPENTELELKNHLEDIEVVYQFSVGKSGPSPLLVDMDILIPIVEKDGDNVLNILEVKGTADGIELSCTPSVIESNTALDDIKDLNLSSNRTILVSCQSEESCMRFSCKGHYLYNSGQLAIFKISMLIKSNLLVLKYNSQLATKNLIALVPAAYQRGLTGSVGASGKFLIFVHDIKYVPLWVYLLAPTIGMIILILMSYGLYKCHFFDRIYKDKLEQEKILISTDDASIEGEIFDDVVFRPMEENIQNKEKEYL